MSWNLDQNACIGKVQSRSEGPCLFLSEFRKSSDSEIAIKEFTHPVLVLWSFEQTRLNSFTPKSCQCQISPAASPEISHHTVWRTWLFIAYSDERWLYYQFLVPHLYIFFLRGWENALIELGTEGVPLHVFLFFAVHTLTWKGEASWSVVWPYIQALPWPPRCCHSRFSVKFVFLITLRLPTWLPYMWYQNWRQTVSLGSKNVLTMPALAPSALWDASMNRYDPARRGGEMKRRKGADTDGWMEGRKGAADDGRTNGWMDWVFLVALFCYFTTKVRAFTFWWECWMVEIRTSMDTGRLSRAKQPVVLIFVLSVVA